MNPLFIFIKLFFEQERMKKKEKKFEKETIHELPSSKGIMINGTRPWNHKSVARWRRYLKDKGYLKRKWFIFWE